MRMLWLPLALVALRASLVAAGPLNAPTAVAADETKAIASASTDGSAETNAATTETSSFKLRRIEFGVQGPDTNTESSRFREYRPLPSGFVLYSLRFAGNERFRYDIRADSVLLNAARYDARLEPGPFDIDFNFQKIPHRFGNDGRALLVERPRSVFVLSDSLQSAHQAALQSQFTTSPSGINFNFLKSLLAPSIAAAPRIDLALMRDRGRLDLGWSPKERPIDLHVIYFEERRYGNRAAGTSFGFGNVVETAEPIEYRTRDVAATLEWKRSWGLVRGGVHYNWFGNKYLTETFDNPFRITDATDASAYSSPGTGSIGGATVGRLSLPPENQALTGSAGMVIKLPAKTRVTADASLSRWTQDSPFMPFTTNTAITAPVAASALSSLPARSLDGKIDIFSLSLNATSRPADKLLLTARYRRYDLDNKTPRVEFTKGYVRFDAVWEDIPRVSVPYGFTTDRAYVSAGYDVGPATLEGGYRYDVWHRTFRETEKTTEGTVFGAMRWRPVGWALIRASAEHGKRDFDGEYRTEESEDASYLNPGPPANLLDLRRFDQAKRDTDRLSGQLQLTPGGNTTVALAYSKAKEKYPESAFGLVNTDVQGLTADVDYTPSERWGVYAFGSRETFQNFQRGRQSGATPSTNTADNWTSTVKDTVDTLGGGLTWAVIKEKADLKLSGSYQRLNGNNKLDSPPGGTPDFAVSIADFDDTKLLSLGAEVAYGLTQSLKLTVGGWLEDYKLRDSATSDITNYQPGGLFMAANDGDYRAHVLYARVSYAW